MAQVKTRQARKPLARKARAEGGKYVIVPATTVAVLKTHGHTLKSAMTLKARLDGKLQLAHVGGK